jgi:hypothetical protein
MPDQLIFLAGRKDTSTSTTGKTLKCIEPNVYGIILVKQSGHESITNGIWPVADYGVSFTTLYINENI